MRLLSWSLAVALTAFGGYLAYAVMSSAPTARSAAFAAESVAVAVPDIVPASEPAAPQPAPAPASSAAPGNAALVDTAWAQRVASATGIPYRAVLGYAGATLALSTAQPTCNLGWSTLAALGNVESGHGTHAGSSLGADGVDLPAVYGPSLDGTATEAIPSAEEGWARAAGPLQFIPSTWQQWGTDGNGDGTADPQQIDDAALTAGRYLCSYGDLSGAAGWRASIFAYNHLDSYVDLVAQTANQYAAEVD